jgi:hypothetical protein
MNLRLKLGKVHAWDGTRLACGPRVVGRGEVVAGPIECVRCCAAENKRMMRTIRSFAAAARKYGFLPKR